MPEINAKFYNIDKRIRSTKRPDETDEYILYNIVFKRPTNILEPDILIDTAGVYPDFTYCIIEIPLTEGNTKDFYYFVKSITITNNNLFELHLKLDSLATTKEQILLTDAYIIYSSSNYNRWIRDDRTPIVARPPEIVIARTTPMIDGKPVFEYSQTDETVILTTYSQDTGVAYWRMSELTIKTMMDSLIRAGSSLSGSMQMLFGDAIGSIISAIRLPVNKMVIPDDGTIYAVQTGSSSYLQAMQISDKYVRFRERVGIPTSYLDYRVFEPYTELKIRLPFVGVCDISHQEFGGSIYVEGLIDLLTGKITYTLYEDENYRHPICNYNGLCGGTMPLAASQISKSSEIVHSLAASMVSLGAAALNPAIGVVGSIGSIASAFYHANQKSTNVLGSYSGSCAEIITTEIEVIAIKHETAVEPENLTAIEGRPCLMVDNLATYTGYIRTQGFQLGGIWFKEIKDEVNALMDSGIYIE